MRYILAQQFKKLRALEDAARTQDLEAVHDMRVACRRVNSAFRFGRAYLPRKRVEPLLPVLENLRDTLGAARNLDVLTVALAEYRAHAPEAAALERLAAAWVEQRAHAQRALEQLLDGDAYADWRAQMDAFLEESTAETTQRVADEIPARLWRQYGKVRAYETRLADAALPLLHALRIEVKRLRYALEFFREPLTAPGDANPKPQDLIDALIALQDLLGEMQDAVVGEQFVTQYLIARVEGETNAVDAAEFHALTRYQHFLRAQVETRRVQAPQYYAALVAPWFREALGALTARL